MKQYAQTNIQLYEQLRNESYSEVNVARIVDAYAVCRSLFTCLYRPSGKTFIAHLVGTASILVSLRVSVDIVVAGLLHAAYSNGDFGTGVYGLSAVKRTRLRQEVGFDAEDYIARYTKLIWWTEKNISAVYCRLDDLAIKDRDVLLIRLANDLEELLDFGWLYWSSVAGRQRYRDRAGGMVVEMAAKIGFPTLASELEAGFNQSVAHEMPKAMQDETAGPMMTASSIIPSRAMVLKLRPHCASRVHIYFRKFEKSKIRLANILSRNSRGFIRMCANKAGWLER